MTMLSNVAAFATPHRLVLWCWWPFEVQYSWWWCFVIWLRLLDWADSGSEFMLGFTGKVYGNGAFSNTVTWKFLGFVTVWGGMFVQFGTENLPNSSAHCFCLPPFLPRKWNWQHKTKAMFIKSAVESSMNFCKSATPTMGKCGMLWAHKVTFWYAAN